VQHFSVHRQATAERGKIHGDLPTVFRFNCIKNLDQNVSETGVEVPSEMGSEERDGGDRQCARLFRLGGSRAPIFGQGLGWGGALRYQ
jgi:hypothetical protein